MRAFKTLLLVAALFLKLSNSLILHAKIGGYLIHARHQSVDRSIGPISRTALSSTEPAYAPWQNNGGAVAKKRTFAPLVALNYVVATALEWTLMVGVMKIFDLKLFPILSKYSFQGISAASGVVTAMMVMFSIRSRIFSPLDNRRPSATKADPVFKERLRPSWQPPPRAFPIIWTTIGLLRVISGTMIFNHVGELFNTPILCFLAHLAIGDTWNTINNVENRLGTSALGVLFVLASVYYTTYQYYLTLPKAAYILAPSCVWLSIATVLVWTIWRMNYFAWGNPPLLPSQEEGPPGKWKLPFMN